MNCSKLQPPLLLLSLFVANVLSFSKTAGLVRFPSPFRRIQIHKRIVNRMAAPLDGPRHHYPPIDLEEREGIDRENDAASSEPVWDPVAQIYVGGRVPENAAVQQMIRANQGALRLFGYGSLCWNPGKSGESALAHPNVTSCTGQARGYRRAWAQKSTDHRGVPAFPGIVCTLLRDDEFRLLRRADCANGEESLTEGLIYEVPPELADECLEELDFREKGVRASSSVLVACCLKQGGFLGL
jgi:cation transport regulator ChaC